MRGRTLADGLLVIAAAVLAYVETFGWTEPAAGLDEFLALFAALDVTVYLVLAGVAGIIFVGYVAIYLPKRISSQSVRDQQG